MKASITRTIAMAIGLLAGSAVHAELPLTDPSLFINKYGKPDLTYSSEVEKPRPPMVTKKLEYRKAGVRVTMLADAPMNTPPPYTKWRLMGFQDIKTNKPITATEFDSRIKAKK